MPTTFADAIVRHGYKLIRCHRPDASSHEALSEFGHIDVVEGLNCVQCLHPHTQVGAAPNTYSGNFGLDVFPLHTDLAHWAIPPRYLALRCIREAPSVGTRLLDGRVLIRQFGANALRSLLVQSRRPMRHGKQLIQLLERIGSSDQFRLRWDSVYLKPASGFSTERFAEVNDFLKHAEPFEVFLLEHGDTLIIDNWRFLHGRSNVSGSATDRHIDRAYLGSIA